MFLQVHGFEKCETDPPGVFSAEIFEYVRQKGGSKSEFWGQNPKILNSWGPKSICMNSPGYNILLYIYFGGLGVIFGVFCGKNRPKWLTN